MSEVRAPERRVLKQLTHPVWTEKVKHAMDTKMKTTEVCIGVLRNETQQIYSMIYIAFVE